MPLYLRTKKGGQKKEDKNKTPHSCFFVQLFLSRNLPIPNFNVGVELAPDSIVLESSSSGASSAPTVDQSIPY